MVNTQIRPLTSVEYYQMMEIYAAAEISEYWIVNLIDNHLEIYRQPEGSIYTSIQIITPHRSVSLPQFVDIMLNVNDFFPASKT